MGPEDSGRRMLDASRISQTPRPILRRIGAESAGFGTWRGRSLDHAARELAGYPKIFLEKLEASKLA